MWFDSVQASIKPVSLQLYEGSKWVFNNNSFSVDVCKRQPGEVIKKMEDKKCSYLNNVLGYNRVIFLSR